MQQNRYKNPASRKKNFKNERPKPNLAQAQAQQPHMGDELDRGVCIIDAGVDKIGSFWRQPKSGFCHYFMMISLPNCSPISDRTDQM